MFIIILIYIEEYKKDKKKKREILHFKRWPEQIIRNKVRYVKQEQPERIFYKNL